MTVALSKSKDKIGQMPLVELAFEILKAKKEPLYFRELMNEIQDLRGMTTDEVNDVIARLYTEINIDGRFTCIGQNVWGLNRWYPVDKATERSLSSKKFVRRSGDAFSDDDEDDEEFEDLVVDEELEEQSPLFDDVAVEEADDDAEDADTELADEETEDLAEEEELETDFEEEPLVEEEDDDEDDEDED